VHISYAPLASRTTGAIGYRVSSKSKVNRPISFVIVEDAVAMDDEGDDDEDSTFSSWTCNRNLDVLFGT
jgi:hypothetical protein